MDTSSSRYELARPSRSPFRASAGQFRCDACQLRGPLADTGHWQRQLWRGQAHARPAVLRAGGGQVHREGGQGGWPPLRQGPALGQQAGGADAAPPPAHRLTKTWSGSSSTTAPCCTPTLSASRRCARARLACARVQARLGLQPWPRAGVRDDHAPGHRHGVRGGGRAVRQDRQGRALLRGRGPLLLPAAHLGRGVLPLRGRPPAPAAAPAPSSSQQPSSAVAKRGGQLMAGAAARSAGSCRGCRAGRVPPPARPGRPVRRACATATSSWRTRSWTGAPRPG